MIIGISQFELLNTRCDVVVASRSPKHVPSVCWGMGGHIHDDRSTVSVWLRKDQALRLLDDIEATGAVSAVFNVPYSTVSFQLKGSDARVRPVAPADLPILEVHCRNMVRELALVDFGEIFARTFFEQPADSLVAVDFTVTSMFEQTPGPRAGKALA